MKHNKKNKPSYAIYNFPYFKREQGFSWLLPLKALLASVTCCAGTVYFNFLLDISKGAGLASFTAVISFLLFYVLFTVFKKRIVWTFVLAAAAVGRLFFGKDIDQASIGFWQHILKVIDGDLISTYWYDVSAADPFPFIILIYAVFGFVCAISSFRRFYPEPILLFAVIAAAPAFLSLSASYHASLGVFIAGMLGQWVVNTSSAVNMCFFTGGVCNMHAADRLYKKGTAKTPKKRRLSMDMQRYGRHLSDGFIMFTATLVTIGIVSSVFPADGAIRFDQIISSTTEFFQNVESWGINLFENFSSPSFEGFFSADGGNINLSGGLSPDGHHRTGVKVAEVFTENTDKIYLRGDIGYSFNGVGWGGVSALDFNNIEFACYNTNSYEYEGNISIQEVFDRYIPEIQYFVAYNSINATKPDHRTYIGLQTVRVKYLRNLNTVLFPGTPVIYNFRENNNFSVKGDFVAFADRGKINSMETGVLYPAQNSTECILDSGFYYENRLLDYLFDDLPVSVDEFMSYREVYNNFAHEYFTELSDEYREIIRPFAERVPKFYYDFGGLERTALIASSIETELNGGEYKYSLTADNFSGDKAPLYSFLYETKSGHCAMYATAMCLALRYYGIPARYVTGFTAGGDNYVSHSDGEYKYELTDSDLHAWVEVYFDGLGWLPYDPTPPAFGSSAVAPSHTAVTTAAPVTTPPVTDITEISSEAVTSASSSETTTSGGGTSGGSDSASPDDPSGGPENDNSQMIKIILTVLGIALALFAVIMSAAGALKGLDRRQRNTLKFFRSGNSDRAVKAMLDFMLRLLLIRNISRQKGETPEMFGRRADKILKYSGTVSAAIPIFEKSEFDKSPSFNAEEQETVYGCIAEMLKDTLENMKPSRRLITRFKLFGRKLGKD